MKELVAILEDEPDISSLVELHLKKSLFEVNCFSMGEDFIDSLGNRTPDLLILDLMLPDMEGIEVCKYIRNDPNLQNMPIIMLTAKSEETDKIIGLEMGADDYVTKPFSPKELVARVKAVLRRQTKQVNTEAFLEVGGTIKIDVDKYSVFVNKDEINLTVTEFKVLEMLAKNPGRVFSRSQILDYLWGADKIVIDRTVDVHVRNLREKLGDSGNLIKNIRGIGYKIDHE